MKSDQLVSIIIPLWNRQRLIGETLASVCGQTYLNLEVLVVDDGSSDDGPAVVAEWERLDERVKLIRRELLPKGAPACRNLGLQSANGTFVIFLDSDDLLTEEAIERRVKMLERHPDSDLVVAQGLIFKGQPGDQNLLWNRCEYGTQDLLVRFLDQDIPWQTSGPLWRRISLPVTDAWNPHLCSFQDWEFHVRMLLRDSKPVVLDHPDFYVRRSDEDRISQCHLEKEHVESRLSALDAVWDLIRSGGKDHGNLYPHVRAFLLRNQLQVIDSGHPHLCQLFVDSAAGQSLLTVLDKLILAWIRRVGPGWHWNSRVMKITKLVWQGLAYDNYQKTDFMETEWLGEIPKVSIFNIES